MPDLTALAAAAHEAAHIAARVRLAALDALSVGAAERPTAAAAGVSRMTLRKWKAEGREAINPDLLIYPCKSCS